MLAVVLAYLAAALVAAATGHLLSTPRWLALHLLFLGAATNAILFYSGHFAETLLHAPAPSRRAGAGQLAAANAAVVAVLAGVDASVVPLVAAGATLLAAVLIVHAGRLVRLLRRSLAGRLRAAPGYYVTASGFLVAGVAAGAVLGARASTSGWLVTLHAEVNLFGWVGLSVLGTLYMLAPAALRTRMPDDVPRVARRSLWLCGTGLAASALALAGRQSTVAAGGMALYAAGVLHAARPLAQLTRRRPPRDVAALSLTCATAWLAAGAGWQVATLATTPLDRVDTAADWLAPALAVGLVAQVLVGALSFLVPVTLGGGPAGGKRMAGVLERGGLARVVLVNIGLAVGLAGPAGPVRAAGYAAALAGLGGFLPLAVLAWAPHAPAATNRRCPRR